MRGGAYAGMRGSMRGFGTRRRLTGLLIGTTFLLCACAHHRHGEADAGGGEGINAYPANYKSDIVAAMHAYLKDPTGIREAAIAEPVLKSSGAGGASRYVVCLKFNAKKDGGGYAGTKEIVALFLAGRFDQFSETPRDLCTGAAYTPFPELQQLPP